MQYHYSRICQSDSLHLTEDGTEDVMRRLIVWLGVPLGINNPRKSGTTIGARHFNSRASKIFSLTQTVRLIHVLLRSILFECYP